MLTVKKPGTLYKFNGFGVSVMMVELAVMVTVTGVLLELSLIHI